MRLKQTKRSGLQLSRAACWPGLPWPSRQLIRSSILARPARMGSRSLSPKTAWSPSAMQIGNIQAGLWYKGRSMNLGQPGLKGQNSMAFSVNAWGQAVGEAQTGSADPQGEDFCGFAALGLASSGTTCLAFLWQNGVMSPLPTLGGNNGVANQINGAGDSVGMAEKDMPDSTCPSGGPQKLEFKPVAWQNGRSGNSPRMLATRTATLTPSTIPARRPVDPAYAPPLTPSG